MSPKIRLTLFALIAAAIYAPIFYKYGVAGVIPAVAPVLTFLLTAVVISQVADYANWKVILEAPFASAIFVALVIGMIVMCSGGTVLLPTVALGTLCAGISGYAAGQL